MHNLKIKQFEGPLDLLLSLIEEQKLNITEIALAEVTEQFLAYIKDLEQIDPTALADFLNIAARLLVIKSKAILPSLEVDTEEELEPEEDLTAKLILYKQFKEVAKHLKELDNRRQQSFTRSLVFSQKINFWPDPAVDKQVLYNSILGVLEQLRELDNLPKAKIREAVSIQEKIGQLQNRLAGSIQTSLSSLLAEAKNKDEVIITFLALLELIKQRIFSVDQDSLFTDVTIKQYTPSQAIIEETIIVDETQAPEFSDDDDDDEEEDEEEDEDEEDDKEDSDDEENKDKLNDKQDPDQDDEDD
jgi:segregation and condensation protein A